MSQVYEIIVEHTLRDTHDLTEDQVNELMFNKREFVYGTIEQATEIMRERIMTELREFQYLQLGDYVIKPAFGSELSPTLIALDGWMGDEILVAGLVRPITITQL